MKQTLRRELTNIIFLILIVAAAVVIYLLSHAEAEAITPGDSPAPATETSSAQMNEQAEIVESAESADAEKKEHTTRGVPEPVFQTHILSSDLYAAEPSRKSNPTYFLTWNGAEQGDISLTYELRDGCISSLEIAFQLPEALKGKPKNDIEKYLFEASEKRTGASAEAIPALLADLLPASDALGDLQQSSIRFWTDQALLLKKPGDKFEDTLDGYHFIAYRRQGDTLQELVCVLFLT
ncbi:MAG: hypothetical protein C0413_01280 [Clostridiales bacterium]|nr:hypothetical protein [Clostridiales bacterium]